DINVINPMHYGFDLYGDMLFTNKDEADKNPERVIKFKEASLKGWEYALNNKEEIIQLIHDKYDKDKSTEHLRFEANIIEEMIDRKNIPLGTIDKGRFQYITELYKEYGLLEKNLQLKDFIFEEFNNTLGLTKKEHNYLKNKKEITYCIDPNWMPFEKLIDGKHVGISSDFFSFFQEEIDIPFTLVPTKSWTESVEFAKERKCDILTLAMETEERKKYFSFTNTYLESPLVLITRNDEFFISNIKDIRNKKIGMVKGYAYKDSLKKKYPNINIIDVNDIEDGLDRVNDGKLYGFIDSLTTTAYQIQNNYLTELKVSAKFDEVWKLGIASRNDEPLLTDILDKVIHKMSFENRQIILNKWVPINIEEDTNYRLVVKWVLGTMAIFGFILYIVIDSNNKLNKEVKKRKKIEKSLLSFNNLIDQHIISSSTDLDGYIIDVSSAFCKRSKYTKEELLGEKLDIIRHPDMPKEIYINLWETIGNNNVWKSELKNKAKDGSVYWVYITISPIYDEYGNKIGYTSISQDITDKKTIEEISITDGLTNIYNRRHFNEFFPKFINSAKRDNQFISFLIMDVDFFKQYNDTYGHQKGDDALIAVANTLKNSTHRSDDYCFRLGGEEFGLLFKSSNKEKAFEFANVILKNIENLKIEHKENKASKYLTASMGLYSSNANDVHNIDEIYKNADIMLYKAKETGRNRVINS
uniref:diguanylate cyclase domain-containing protein n=1 Tax=Aliarcobacter sp. TaxID=2321116 RepID=UPI004047F15B